jgi:hypothetical protein
MARTPSGCRFRRPISGLLLNHQFRQLEKRGNILAHFEIHLLHAAPGNDACNLVLTNLKRGAPSRCQGSLLSPCCEVDCVRIEPCRLRYSIRDGPETTLLRNFRIAISFFLEVRDALAFVPAIFEFQNARMACDAA